MNNNEKRTSRFIGRVLGGLLAPVLAIGTIANAKTTQNINKSNVTVEEQESKMEEQKFIEEMAKYAVEAGKKYNVYTSVIIASGIVESGWGKDLSATKYNNFFGIKETPTTFKSYKDMQDSVNDYARLLGEDDKYAKTRECYDKNKGAIAQLKELTSAGYSEAGNYFETLRRIIEQYNLGKYDEQLKKDKGLKERIVVEVPTTKPFKPNNNTLYRFEDKSK